MNYRLMWRKAVNGMMLGLTGVCALLAVSVLFSSWDIWCGTAERH